MIAQNTNNGVPWDMLILVITFVALEVISGIAFRKSYIAHTFELLIEAMRNIILEFLSGDTPKMLCSVLVSTALFFDIIFKIIGIKTVFMKPSPYWIVVFCWFSAFSCIFLAIVLYKINVTRIVPWLTTKRTGSHELVNTMQQQRQAYGNIGENERDNAEIPLESEPRVIQPDVFISYSHKDKLFLEKLHRMLAPLTRGRNIFLWDDTRIAPGQDWKHEIEDALDRAKVAILLVSDNFLASEFINENELPPILENANQKNLKILWIYLSHCMYEETAISKYQAAHRPLAPLDGMSNSKQKKVLKEICKSISDTVAGA